jgi:beta-galactosidase/beta-glucuronidase
MRLFFAFLLLPLFALPALATDWAPKTAPLMTRWAKDVDPAKPLPEYPRPTMVREQWQNLNGLWEYAIAPKDEPRPDKFDGTILVPFPVESALSGVMQTVGPEKRLWYRRSFKVASEKYNQRTLLHFGACDWETTVWVNKKEVRTHRGGYDPFTIDITGAVKLGQENTLVVAVWDPSDAGPQPRGKQVRKPGGIWYTPTTGIWQTVWLELVEETYVRSLHVVPDVDTNSVTVRADVAGPTDKVEVVVGISGISDDPRATRTSKGKPGELLHIDLPESAKRKLWTPDSPHLFDMGVSLVSHVQPRPGFPANNQTYALHDEVKSYFAMRKTSIGKDEKGVTRLLLNNKPVFQFGPLDQGFWPDGIYTAPTDEALKSDIETTKKLGFNMARKHVKVEPERWYYWCDKLGLLVWQDMPSGDKEAGRKAKGEIKRSPESVEIYDRELKALIDARRNHPCIVMWVPFNEGWGQFDTARVTEWVKKYDPSRLVNCASGWNDFPVGDVHDIHVYRGPGAPKAEDHRAAVLGEFGGLGLPLKGHTWVESDKNWGYGGAFKSAEDMTADYLSRIEKLQQLIGPGLSAAIYTQTTDVEVEVNGLMTYDRAVIKMPVEKVLAAHKRLYEPAK